MASEKREVLWARHGSTRTTEDDIFQAGNQIETDPLVEKGEQQAQLLAEQFDALDYKPDVILVSGLLRTRQTARYIGAITGAHMLVPVYGPDGAIVDKPIDAIELSDEPLLRELDMPDELAGLAFADPRAKAIKSEIAQHLFDRNWHYSNEENLLDIWNRAGDIIDYITNREEDKLVIVAHGGIIKACKEWTTFAHLGWPIDQQLKAYRARADIVWMDNGGFVPSFQYRADGRWQWPETHNYHLASKFGFMTKEPEETTEGGAERVHRDGA